MLTATVVSAGGVVLDEGGRVVVTGRLSFKGVLQWGLPKGEVEPNESPEQAALREVTEETGLLATLAGPLQVIDYWYVQPAAAGRPSRRVHKFVHYFLMDLRGGDPAAHDAETTEVRVVPLQEALQLITFPSERALIETVSEMRAG